MYFIFAGSPPDEPDTNLTINSTVIDDVEFEFVERNEYGAQLPKSECEQLILPVKRIIISHTATTDCIDYVSVLCKI